MDLHSRLCSVNLCGDLFVSKSGGHQLENFELAVGEFDTRNVFGQSARHGIGQYPALPPNSAYRVGDLVAKYILCLLYTSDAADDGFRMTDLHRNVTLTH